MLATDGPRLLPLAGHLRRGERCALHITVCLLALMIAGTVAHQLSGWGAGRLDQIVRDWASSAIYVLAAAVVVLRAVRVPESRGPWILLAAALCLYVTGNLLWALWLQDLESPPIPSVADALWLALYPASYAALMMLARGKAKQVAAGVWLDGIIAGLALAAVGAAIVFEPVLEAAEGSPAAVATNLAYPVADLLLAALVVGVVAVRGWRLDRFWSLLGAGFLVLCVADVIYLLHVAGGASDASLVANVFYLSAVGLLALAAWQPPSAVGEPAASGWSVLFAPAVFALAVVGLLLYDHWERLDPLALTLTMLTLAALFTRTVLAFRDVRTLAETRRDALTDLLTGLPNRRLFLRRADEQIEFARAEGLPLALLIIDLDRFKELNDTLGHHAGDLVLSQIGPRLRARLRIGDTLARLGGDEFGLVLSAPCDAQGALRVAAEMRKAIAAPFEVEGLHLRVGASIGIALCPEHGADTQRLLQRADIAMYQAKSSQTGSEIYARDRDSSSRETLALAGQLPQAIASGELELRFQPKADARTRRVVGVEALVRWRHPQRGLLAPALFVGMAEQAGLVRDMTRWVIENALAECSTWRAAGHDIHVAVNVTAADLLDIELPDEVEAALEAHRLPASALVVEVTESSLMADPVRIGNVLQMLCDLGVRVALDDFGTGYSSLMHLKTLPVSEVKIDRQFVARMGSDRTDAAIVQSTIQLAHNLGMQVVAEGVEDEATWSRLAALECELVQGYHLARPLPSAELSAFLDDAAARPPVPIRAVS